MSNLYQLFVFYKILQAISTTNYIFIIYPVHIRAPSEQKY